MTGRSSVPNIWIAGKNVGGCNDGPGVATLQASTGDAVLRAALDAGCSNSVGARRLQYRCLLNVPLPCTPAPAPALSQDKGELVPMLKAAGAL